MKNRQKLDLYNEYENDNLDLWINNGQIKDNKCEKNIKNYYKLIFQEGDYLFKLKDDQDLFDNLLFKLDSENESIEKLKDIFLEILNYEIFIMEIDTSQLQKKMIITINHYLALKLLIFENIDVDKNIKGKVNELLILSKGKFDNKKLKITNIKNMSENIEYNKKILLIDMTESTIIVLEEEKNHSIVSKEVNGLNFNEYKFEIIESDKLQFRTHRKMSNLAYIEV
ncbi:hypothetical protein QTP93_00110 [Staphylococcus borealis]|uniref:hypothetical protein n=1 Tax=Staphylococcus borealis TaxID=2742203 RepID=UPI0025A20F31|nr:hypothetical protein [Staphylococcus borealis]MDM7862364.1 hypothetical protein [Staphylococcus borealis]